MTQKVTPQQVHDILRRYTGIPGSYGSYRVDGDKLVVEFNGATRSFPLPKPPKPPKPTPDDLTVIPGVGAVTAAALANAGLDTYDKLRAAPGETIINATNHRTLEAIREHFKERHPQ